LGLLVALGVLAVSSAAFGARPLPNIHGVDPVTGKQVNLADYAGRPVVINVWGAWCSECQDETPALKRFQETHPGVALIGVDVHDTKASARQFYAHYDQEWPSIYDPKGLLASSIGAPSAPTTLFLDRRHRVVVVIYGPGTLARFDAAYARARRAA
jgi:thiol-disulfide isomerase/thioredoxin